MNQFSAVIEGMEEEYLPTPRGVEAPMSDLNRRTTVIEGLLENFGGNDLSRSTIFAQGITGGYIKRSGRILRRIDSLPRAGRLDNQNRGEIRQGLLYFQSPNF